MMFICYGILQTLYTLQWYDATVPPSGRVLISLVLWCCGDSVFVVYHTDVNVVLLFVPLSHFSLQTSMLNKHLSSLMPGLTAKVFRTYNASITLQQQLKELTNSKSHTLML